MATIQQGSHEANSTIAGLMDNSANEVGTLANGILNSSDSLYSGFQGVDGEAFKELLVSWVNMAKQIQSGMEGIRTTMITNDTQSSGDQQDHVTMIRNDSVFGIMNGGN
jgi:hypothetical protein